MTEVRFQFDLTDDHGWAIGELRIGSTCVRREASYITDAPAGFIGVISSLVCCDTPQLGLIRSCVWEEEPGGTLWEAELFGERTVEVRVYGPLSDNSDGRRLAAESHTESCKAKRMMFAERCALLDLGRAVQAGLERALLGWGLEKWRGRWGHEFPIGAYFTLVRGLDALEGRAPRRTTFIAEMEALRAVEGPEMPSR